MLHPALWLLDSCHPGDCAPLASTSVHSEIPFPSSFLTSCYGHMFYIALILGVLLHDPYNLPREEQFPDYTHCPPASAWLLILKPSSKELRVLALAVSFSTRSFFSRSPQVSLAAGLNLPLLSQQWTPVIILAGRSACAIHHHTVL